MAGTHAPPLERIFRRTVTGSGGCVLFQGAKTQFGYGIIRIEGRNYITSRVVWEAANGPIAEGLFVCHRCDVPACVNIDHPFLGTCADNQQDAAKKRRIRHGAQHHNAKLTPEDVRRARRQHAAGGVSMRALALQHGVSPATMQDVIHRVSWTHITEELIEHPSV